MLGKLHLNQMWVTIRNIYYTHYLCQVPLSMALSPKRYTKKAHCPQKYKLLHTASLYSLQHLRPAVNVTIDKMVI